MSITVFFVNGGPQGLVNHCLHPGRAFHLHPFIIGAGSLKVGRLFV